MAYSNSSCEKMQKHIYEKAKENFDFSTQKIIDNDGKKDVLCSSL